jgi:hypothetical protein
MTAGPRAKATRAYLYLNEMPSAMTPDSELKTLSPFKRPRLYLVFKCGHLNWRDTVVG